MVFDRQKINKENILDVKLFEQILKSDNFKELEEELYKIVDELKIKTKFEKLYLPYKKLYMQANNKLEFGEEAPHKVLFGGQYRIEQGRYIISGQNREVCAQLIQPVTIYENVEEAKQLVQCAYLTKKGWKYFVIDRADLMHNGRIIKLAQRGVDVSTHNAGLVVKYIQDMINMNEDLLFEKRSISRLGWFGDDFIPYDDNVTYDGDDNFKEAFDSIKEEGSFEKWLEEMYSIRNNVAVRLLHATSFASVLLRKLKKKSFVTMLWGTTGDGKTVAGMTAMSIWGNPAGGKLMFTLNNTDNFYYRTANFFYDLPIFFDELETYRGDINRLIMNITEGVDRGKAKVDGGTEKNKSWNNAFIMTGEHTASDASSGGGTLNRLIEINSDGRLIEDGAKTVEVIIENHGHAGKIFIEKLKTIPKEKLREVYDYECAELLKLVNTENKQAQNMAMLLLADVIACKFIFTKQNPLQPKDVAQFMFTKEEIDVSERAYESVCDEIAMNRNRFILKDDNSLRTMEGGYAGVGELWGAIGSYDITINKKKLAKILTESGFSMNKTLKDWCKKGYIEKFGTKYATLTTVGGIKSYYVVIKKKGGE